MRDSSNPCAVARRDPMRPDLFEQCPVCSPILGNAALTLVPLVEDPLTGDILEGWLLGRDNDRYPILGGVAILVPDPGAYVASRPSQWELSEIVSPDLRQWVQEQSLRPSQDRYDSPRVIDEYLWTHYGGPPEPPAPPLPDSWTAFYQPVAQALGNLPPEYRTVYAVDAGCNVGRLA
ncbi:MAG TPA: hypothetical protein VEI97_13795, partial [bacterium]|nr:hypothetical protein [bacterium]